MPLAEISGRRCGEEAGKQPLFANRKSRLPVHRPACFPAPQHQPCGACPERSRRVGHSCPTLLTFLIYHTPGCPIFRGFSKEPALSVAEGWEPRTSAKLFAVIKFLLLASSLIGLAGPLRGQEIPRPSGPDQIKAPANEDVILVAHGTGWQIYTCELTGGTYGWKLKAPDAELRDSQGTIIGHHFAGPTWKHNDGSEVTGKAVAKVDSPQANSIPWLLVTATGHSGNGAFARATTIQRINTHGGQPPPAADCNASKPNNEAKSAYTADYYFYAPAK
jgi:Protein of unknown function (DUF3455)